MKARPAGQKDLWQRPKIIDHQFRRSRKPLPPKKKCVKKMNEVERPKIFIFSSLNGLKDFSVNGSSFCPCEGTGKRFGFRIA
jgi:hypothetical protein